MMGHTTCESQHPSLKETWGPPWPANGRQGFPRDTAAWPALSRLPRGSHAQQPPPAAGAGFGEWRLPSVLPAGAPAHPAAGRTRHAAAGAAEARSSPPAQPGRRADLDGAQRWAAGQAAPAPPAQPAQPCTGTSAHAVLQAQGTQAAAPGCWMGTTRDPHRLPLCLQSWAGQFPTPTGCQCCRKQAHWWREASRSHRCPTTHHRTAKLQGRAQGQDWSNHLAAMDEERSKEYQG